MRKSRNIARYIFSLILAVSVLMSGFVSSGYSRSQHLITSLEASHPPAAQDVGESWQPVNTGLSSLDIAALGIDPVNTATIYAGTRSGMFKSTDGGATWNIVELGYHHVSAIAINFVNPNIVHVGVADGGWCNATFPLFKSTDGGESWSNQGSPAECDMSMIVMDPSSANTLYAGSFIQYTDSGSITLWKSTDGGATWNSQWFGPLAPYTLAIDPVNPQILYAPGDLYFGNENVGSGLFKSTDGGANWSVIGLGNNTHIRALAIDPINHDTLYAGSIDYGDAQAPFRGMLKSTDGGANWLTINNGLTNISIITTIVVDRHNPSILYIGTSGGVFKSTDGGANWSAFNDGLTNLDIRVLTLAPGNPNTLYAGTSGGVFKITENTPATNPIDDAQTFVRQQYLDFLGREPDQAGLDYWTSRITECGTDEQCINDRRVAVSAAFFIEQEFQSTGYYVYSLYKASLNRQPNYAEFTSDRSKVVDGDNLEARKQAFADEWVGRASFQQEYPLSMSAEEFVNKLFDTAGLVPYTLERQQEIALLSSQAETRAQVLRDVIEIQEFKTHEYNAAFVRMQYFGYLHRDPDSDGEAFWLNVLNNKLPQDSSGYRAMVCAFINSREYQLRFSPVVTRNDRACGSIEQ